jgi:hypothetical protein
MITFIKSFWITLTMNVFDETTARTVTGVIWGIALGTCGLVECHDGLGRETKGGGEGGRGII